MDLVKEAFFMDDQARSHVDLKNVIMVAIIYIVKKQNEYRENNKSCHNFFRKYFAQLIGQQLGIKIF